MRRHEPTDHVDRLLAQPFGLVRVRLEPAYTVVQAEPDRSLRFDLDGRWATAHLGDRFLRRKVDGGVFLVPGAGPGVDLPADTAWHGVVAALADGLRAALEAPGPGLQVDGDAPAAALRLSAVAAWTPERWQAQARLFEAAYPEPVPILPPDRYRDLVVLPATGCPYGRCAFCAWYREARFQVLSPGEFEAHLDRLERLFGAGRAIRNGLFLGSASAFSVPDRQLVPQLERASARFGPFERGVAGFLDPDHAPRREEADWRALAALGVRRVVVGLETAHPPLRAELGKGADPGPLMEAVRTFRRAGISAGISVLTGAGPEALDAAHLDETVRALASLGLTAEDVVYVSPLLGAASPPRAERLGRAFTRRLRALGGPKVSPYRPDLYRYFAW